MCYAQAHLASRHMKALFTIHATASDMRYLTVRDDPRFKALRDYLERLWDRFCPYADPNFRTELATRFQPRFWELYLGCSLLEMGLSLTPRLSSEGPDLHFNLDGRDTWIEAIAPDAGTGNDEVPGYSSGFFNVPEKKIILRLTHSILEKCRKYRKYKTSKLLNDDDRFVIAINGADIPYSELENDIPYIVKAVLGFGDLTVAIDPEKMEVVDQYHQYRGHVQKKAGSHVPTLAFRSPGLSFVSGILYSRADLWNLPSCLGNDFVFIHNPYANHPMRIGWLPRSRSYWVDGDKLETGEGVGCS